MKNELNKIYLEVLGLEKSLCNLQKAIENEYVASSKEDVEKYYNAKRLLKSMQEIEIVLSSIL